MKREFALGFALALLGVAPSAVHARPSAQATPSNEQIELAARARVALARDTRDLPRSAEGRWSKWGPKDPVPAELQRELGAGIRAYSAGDYAVSLAYLHALLEREAEFPPALYEAGLCYFRLRRYGDAAAIFERFTRVVPNEIGETQALGHCYYSLGDYERARAHYEKVLAASATKIEAIRGLALSEMRLQNPARAIELLRKVLELRPNHADAHAWLAQILFDEGDTAAALLHAERARDIEPWEPRPWFLLSRIYAELDRTAESETARARFETNSRVAQQVLQQEGLLLHDPSRANVWRELIALRRASENRPAVLEALPRLRALGPLSPQIALTVVDAYEWLGDLEHAKLAARDAETTAGLEKAAWSWLAEFYQRVGDKDSAERAGKAAAAGH